MTITDLRKSFGSLAALQGVSFKLGHGERIALLGPNGAGKTTLIRCLSGRTRPDSGTITINGHDANEFGARDALGLVPQEIAIYADLTTRENLTAFGRFNGLRGRDLTSRVDWALQWTGLADRAKDVVGSFSGGMKRRVNIACGVLHSPSILLLDEPTVGVDPQSRERIFVMLDELSRLGTSILLTTHHLDEAQQRCDRIVIVDHGRVVADGTFGELVEQTVGRSRMVTLSIDRPLGSPIQCKGLNATPDTESTATPTELGTLGEDRLSARIDDVAIQLPLILESLRGAGYGIFDIEVSSPSLHHVFLHLTGRELRD
jgi:ABC-2 type transport system ATP-binding protein